MKKIKMIHKNTVRERRIKRGQDEATKEARLNRGLCPTHGSILVPESVVWEKGEPVGDLLKCSRKDCTFLVECRPKTKLWRAIHDKIVS